MDSDVIVVGAGAAGLAVALELAANGCSVTVLEARDRIGGRVRWERIGTVDEPVELGAEFIHGDAPETAAYLREAGLRRVATGGESWRCAADGKLEPADDFDAGGLFERAGSLAPDESVATFLERFAGDPAFRDQVRRARLFVEGFEAADPARASARSIADELRSGVDETSSRPAGGYAPLFAHLADRCERAGIDLRLDTPVQRIGWNTSGVHVGARDGSGTPVTLHARFAIVTVPIGVLREGDAARTVRFEPPLPQPTLAALAGLEIGHVVRVTLAFRTPFWESLAGGRYRDAAFFRCEDGPFAAFWTQAPQRSRTIVAWAGGPRAQQLDGVAYDERIERACDAFGALFGERDLARREREAGVTHDWSADPFARGAYSYVATGGGTARSDLARPIGETVFFAGEATAGDGQGGTVSGAFATGLRAAGEVLRARDR